MEPAIKVILSVLIWLIFEAVPVKILVLQCASIQNDTCIAIKEIIELMKFKRTKLKRKTQN